MKIRRIFAAILTIIIALSIITTASAQAFTDVPEAHPYKAAIDFCQAKGIVLGISHTTFDPDAKLTRGQLATIWCRALDYIDENHSFADITSLKNYYDTPSIVLHSIGAFTGISDTKFEPAGYITREQLAVLTMRTYNLGFEDQEAYKQYADHASISKWARDGVSSCINAGVFDGLYDQENFLPGEPVTRAEICQLVYHIQVPEYTITIDDTEGGTITADRTKARPGTLITLTVTPDTGKQLKTGTLKYDDTEITDKKFIMPAKNITITAEFEDVPVLESIAVTTPPANTTYTAGEALDLSGMVITATYSDGSTAAVTGYTTAPAEGSTLDTEGTVPVTVTYAEGEIEKTAAFNVQVNAPENGD